MMSNNSNLIPIPCSYTTAKRALLAVKDADRLKMLAEEQKTPEAADLAKKSINRAISFVNEALKKISLEDLKELAIKEGEEDILPFLGKLLEVRSKGDLISAVKAHPIATVVVTTFLYFILRR